VEPEREPKSDKSDKSDSAEPPLRTRGRAFTFASFLNKKATDKPSEKKAVKPDDSRDRAFSVVSWDVIESDLRTKAELEKALLALKSDEKGSELAALVHRELDHKDCSSEEMVMKVIDIMNSNPENHNLITGGLLSIKYIKDQSGLKTKFREKGGFPILIKLMSSPHDQIRLISVRFAGDTIIDFSKKKRSRISPKC